MPDQAHRLRLLAAQSRPADPPPAVSRLATGARREPHAPTRDSRPDKTGRDTPTDDSIRIPQLEARARTIAVTSGKGGVGKTCLTVNLGLALAQLGHRVIVLDLDLGLANVDVMTDVRSRHNLYHVLVGRKNLRDVVVPGPGGILIVPGASGIHQLADLADVRRQDLITRFAELETLADYLLIDTAAGIGRNVIGFAQAADQVLVVTTPEPTAVTDAYAVIKTICRCREHGELHLVVNMAANQMEADRVSRRITGVARQFLSVFVEEVGYVVADEYLREAVCLRRPLLEAFPKAPAAACIHEVARVLCGQPLEVGRPRGFFARLADAFRRHPA